MRYSAAEKFEIIRLVEQSHLSVRRTLARIGIPPTTFYRWYDHFLEHGPERLEDRSSRPSRVWNRIPEAVRDQIVDLALEEPELSPRELAVRFTDRENYFVSEASVYRLLKSHDLITSPAYIVIKAAEEFKDKTTAPNQMWQTDFTYLKVIGWGWFYLSTILDDFSRYVIGWKLCGTMRAEDVTDTLDIALAASGCGNATVLHKPRLLSDNGSSYIAGELAEYLEDKGMKHVRGAPMHPQTQGKIERWHQTLKNRILLENYFLEVELEAAIAAFIDPCAGLEYVMSAAAVQRIGLGNLDAMHKGALRGYASGGPVGVSAPMTQQGGGTSKLEVSLSPDLEGRILEQARGQTVQITQQGIRQFSSQMPDMVQRINRNPRDRW